MAYLARFIFEEKTDWGFVDGDTVFAVGDKATVADALGDSDLLAKLIRVCDAGRELNLVQLLPPVPDPPQFLGVGLNYRHHAAESGVDIPPEPITFGLLRNSIIGDGDVIRIPSFTDQADWEAELGVVIGIGGCDIPEADALRHVAGYTIVNDVSARDIQMAEGQWGRSKSFDSFKPMGPWVTTTDVLGDASDLKVSLWVNDELKQSSNTSDLIFSVPELVSRLSRSTTLNTGAVISTGTPHGVGFSRNPPEFLQPGDSVSIEIERIGRLTNRVERSAN
jgi:2-keto-4-pentenoate hydratase/2-oxohepta-3-ene-1,7-dioic acid hydratase in catechol pathway